MTRMNVTVLVKAKLDFRLIGDIVGCSIEALRTAFPEKGNQFGIHLRFNK
jgi:hypothetical protein